MWTGRLIYAIALLPVLLGVVAYLTWFERKFAAIMHNRVGPYNVGRPHGWLQAIADVIKLLTKANTIPDGSDRIWFRILPFFVPFLSLASIGLLPASDTLYIWNTRYGVILFLALSGLTGAVVFLAAWASNNKWASLSALRLAAQYLGYEIPLFASLLTVAVLAGSLRLIDINASQTGWWWIAHPLGLLAFLCYLPAALAEANKVPFDIGEAESELVSAFNTEYSGIRFAMFYLAEYIHLITTGWIAALFFFGGSHFGPWNSAAFTFAKIGIWIVFLTWIRWGVARLRIDQMLRFNWHWLVPFSLLVFVAATLGRGSGLL